ncbi:MAG TPA: hypothetical protein VFU31_24955 [Candidatus Binatia bacterium]|nr:hypothetical protein [Candidatus Binatia bacterium]
MAGVKGMHERLSTSPAYAEKVRARIRAGGIARRLEDHVIGKVEMTASQVTAALGLLKKVVPDLSHQTLDGSVDVNHRLLING